VDDGSPPEAKAAFYAALFAARTDVYATRFDNPRTGKGGWVPAVRGGWRKGIRHEDLDYLPLTPAVLAAHLKGEVRIGLYPLLDGDKCWWLAADFDGPGVMFDALFALQPELGDCLRLGTLSGDHRDATAIIRPGLTSWRANGCPPSTAPPADQARRPSLLAGAKPCRTSRAPDSGLVPMTGGPVSVVVVVETAGDDGNHVGLDVVHEPVLLGYPA